MFYYWDGGSTGLGQPNEGFKIPTEAASTQEVPYSAGIAYAEADQELKEQALANQALPTPVVQAETSAPPASTEAGYENTVED